MAALAPARADLDVALHAAMEAEADGLGRLALRLLGNEADAADALQEAWVRAWSRRADWRGDGPPGAWLRAIVARECLRAMRWRSVRRWLPFGEKLPDVEAPESGTEAGLDAERVRAVLTALPPQQRACFTLRFYEGWTVPEIAASLDLGDETVKTHLARALDRVRARLGGSRGL